MINLEVGQRVTLTTHLLRGSITRIRGDIALVEWSNGSRDVYAPEELLPVPDGMSELEAKFIHLWVELYPDITLQPEYSIVPKRRFRWDFVHLQSQVAVELQGAIWINNSGHSSGKGLLRDYEKLNLATSLGWRVYMLSESMITAEWLKVIVASILDAPF